MAPDVGGFGGDGVGDRWCDDGSSDTEKQFPFDPVGWRCGIPFWPPAVQMPNVLPTGLLDSFGEEARRLLSDHFSDRVQLVVRPDTKTVVKACVVHQHGAAGLEHEEATRAVVDVQMTEGPVGISTALFTGECGILRAKVTLGHLFGLTAFGAGQFELNADAKDESNTAGFGLTIDRPSFRGLVATQSATSLHDWGKVFVGCGVARFGSMMLGIETKVSRDVDEAEFGDSACRESGDSPQHYGIGDAADGNGWGRVYLENLNVRAVYSGSSLSRFTGEPESFQIGLSIENLGRRLVASYFHHIAVRESFAATPYWRGISLGGEFVQNVHSDGGTGSNAVAVGASWQPFEHLVVKMRGTTRGTVDVAVASRMWNVHEMLPLVNLSVMCGIGVHDMEPTFGLSCGIGE
eukprot:m.375071 g.375071  ORF g.375071 m.375071 type:complete len:406 (+) comp20913_c0_seq2:203-1420(+)